MGQMLPDTTLPHTKSLLNKENGLLCRIFQAGDDEYAASINDANNNAGVNAPSG
jgi:hypothetical protein